MTPQNLILDTNAVIRFIIGDDIAAFGTVRDIIIEEDSCTVPIEVIAEVVYNLRDKYGMTRQEVADRIKEFALIKEDIIAETNVVRFALNLYASSKFDFVDCLLDGYAKEKGISVFTFDIDLRRRLKEKAFNA
ncbi:MAG: PIN domain-containing protein [Spirochaetaceae bacterium]|jgi:predicted nucleic-acid-binding protein|nr:PIN domain-containing protein [Spirochaetaceae bacterium]